jgi:hypothetical protein
MAQCCNLQARVILHNPPVENPCLRMDAAEEVHERASGSEEVMRDGFPTALVSVRRHTTTTRSLGIQESGTLFSRRFWYTFQPLTT